MSSSLNRPRIGGIDVEAYVRAFLDGAVGDENPTTLDDARAGVERSLTDRIRRPLTSLDRERIGTEVAVAWSHAESNRHFAAVIEEQQGSAARVLGEVAGQITGESAQADGDARRIA